MHVPATRRGSDARGFLFLPWGDGRRPCSRIRKISVVISIMMVGFICRLCRVVIAFGSSSSRLGPSFHKFDQLKDVLFLSVVHIFPDKLRGVGCCSRIAAPPTHEGFVVARRAPGNFTSWILLGKSLRGHDSRLAIDRSYRVDISGWRDVKLILDEKSR